MTFFEMRIACHWELWVCILWLFLPFLEPVNSNIIKKSYNCFFIQSGLIYHCKIEKGCNGIIFVCRKKLKQKRPQIFLQYHFYKYQFLVTMHNINFSDILITAQLNKFIVVPNITHWGSSKLMLGSAY